MKGMKSPEIDWSLVPALDVLLSEGSVTGAARRLGLSTPAMSHALARLREAVGDPLLVRAGRAMVLTPRALALREPVRDLVARGDSLLGPVAPFAPGALAQTFRLHATDHVLAVAGVALDRLARAEAPNVRLRFMPNVADDAGRLREGTIDLAVGIYG